MLIDIICAEVRISTTYSVRSTSWVSVGAKKICPNRILKDYVERRVGEETI